ncbi:MAG: serpin family protein [Nocardioidaceae bacterium]
MAHLEASDVAMAKPSGDVTYADAASGARELGHDLATRISTPGGNLIYSPTSLALAFALLREGAQGDTAKEIDQVLHLPANRQSAYNGVLHELADPGDGDVLEINDGLFVDPSMSVKQSYLESIKKWYGAGVEQTEFPDEALTDINAWVDDNTDGRIPHLMDHLDQSAKLALVNTIYMNAKWATPFDAAKTHDGTFTTTEGADVTAKMMHRTGAIDYASGQGWQAVRLPYKGGELSMWVLLPTSHQDPRALLAADTLAQAGSGFGDHQVKLSLPRWDTSTTANLVPVLKDMGMQKPFGGAADFGGFTSDGSFAVSNVVQQANITVGEKGTKAAAATAVIGSTAAPAEPPDLVEFDADHPFAFALVHDPTGVPLFEGVVADPS